MDYIPTEVWEQIFLKLPVKTLVRCTCVCVSLQTFIQKPSFINAHLQIQRRDLKLVRTYVKEDEEEESIDKEAYTVYCDDETFLMYGKFDFPFTRSFGHCYRIVGNCNGVLCITSGRCSMDDTNLWNPTIRKSIELPPPRVTFKSHGGFDQELGFGYDAKTNDYKVVRIVELSTHGFHSWRPLEVDLYTLNTGHWRNISHLALDIKCHVFDWAPPAYLNETAHWVAEFSRTRKVVLFDFGREVFRFFKIPNGISPQISYFFDDSKLWPVIVQGSLSLVEQCNTKYTIWMMKEYGDSSSWIKWLDIDHFAIERLIGFRKQSEVLLQIERKLCSFDYEKAQGNDLNILRGFDLDLWNILQQEHIYDGIFGQHIQNYDPNAAPKDLGIPSVPVDSFDSFEIDYCEGFIESLALIGKSTPRLVADQCQSEEECMESPIEKISE